MGNFVIFKKISSRMKTNEIWGFFSAHTKREIKQNIEIRQINNP